MTTLVTDEGNNAGQNSRTGAAFPAAAPPLKGTPGRRTLKNFLATALMPVGSTLYVYGGGWNRGDTGAGPDARAIGLSPLWGDFFRSQTASYHYKRPGPAESGGFFRGQNEYGCAGLDCSGYVGWTLYNTMNTASGGAGFVTKSTDMAKALAERGWGTSSVSFRAEEFRPGDIFSMNGHVWICLGRCGDGSLVILHSAPGESRTGGKGGGPQLGAVGPSRKCEACRLAERYMSRYFPEWSRRYPAALQSYEAYTAISGGASGLFHWNFSGAAGGLTDPEGYRDLGAERILADLFRKNQ